LATNFHNPATCGVEGVLAADHLHLLGAVDLDPAFMELWPGAQHAAFPGGVGDLRSGTSLIPIFWQTSA
jgi:hypothetical protein